MITEAYLLRHAAGKQKFRDAALVDIAQDHAIELLHRAGAFEFGLVLKGGTSLRKYRMGNDGRFSTDLDFATPDNETSDLVLSALDGASLDGFTFTTELVVERRARLHIDSTFGKPLMQARIDINPKAPWLPVEVIGAILLPIHERYSFSMTPTPIMRIEEVLSEKLARYRRARLARDLYDLQWYGRRTFDEALVRRLTVLKVWTDVVQENWGERPFDPSAITQKYAEHDFDLQAIGYLTTKADVEEWMDVVSERYKFLHEMSQDERRVAACNPRDYALVQAAIAALA